MNETAQVQDNIVEFPQPAQPSEFSKLWIKTPVANLWKYVPTGMYYCVAKIHGRIVRRSFKTASFEIAKIKLGKLISEERGRISTKDDAKLTFEDLAERYEKLIRSNPDLTDRAKDYRIETIKQIRGTWPDVDKMKPRDFTEFNLLEWAGRLRAAYSPTRYNGAIQTMRGILQIGVDHGILLVNPVVTKRRHSQKGIPQAPVPVIPPTVPTQEQFKLLLERLDAVPVRRRASIAVRFLAYSGCRIGAALRIMPDHVDLEKNEIVIPKDKRNPNPRRIPMIPEMRSLVEKLLAEHPDGGGPLIEIKSPKKALKNACKEAGINPPMTPHDLRHLFATRAIECDTDPRTLGELLGHKDGGRLAMRTYAHVRNDHAQETASKISFGAEPEKAVDEVEAEQVSWEI